MRIFQGYTLIEVLIMLSIVVILTTISVPMFTSIIDRNRVSATAEHLYYFLQYARSEAVKRNATIYVSFISGDNWCYGMSTASSCNCNVANSCGLGNVSTLKPEQISLSTTGLSSNTISFDGTRGAANASGSVTFTLYGQSSLVRINIGRLGALQMCSTGIGGFQAC